MVCLKNVECYISTANGHLEEYTDPDDTGGTVGGSPCSIVYIKSEEGQQFSVCISLLNDIGITPTANAISYSLSFDGEIIPDRMLLFPGERLVPRSGFVSATESGGFVQRQFHFSKLNVTEDGPKPKDGGGTDTLALGEICVSVLRFCKTGESSVSHYAQRKVPTGITTLHEKQLKGRDIAHSIGLSTPQPATKPNFVAGRYIDTNANPYLTIKFRYRSERALKGLGLIPRTPLPSLSPEPEENSHRSSSVVRGMSRKELEAEVLKLRNQSKSDDNLDVKKENKDKVKRERADSGPSNIIKKRKKPLTIDLTEDSD